MKTMLTLDDDIADYLKEQSRLHGKHFKRVVNETQPHDHDRSIHSQRR